MGLGNVDAIVGDAEIADVEVPTSSGDAASDDVERTVGPADAESAAVDMERDAPAIIELDKRGEGVVEPSFGSVADDNPDCRSLDPLPLPDANGFLASLSSDPWSVLSSSSSGPWPALESTVPTWREEGSEKRVGRHGRCG